MMNTVNWKTLRDLTGCTYRCLDSVIGGDEWFPVYERIGNDASPGQGPAVEAHELFIDCLHPTANRKMFNPMPFFPDEDPNPTVIKMNRQGD